MKHVEVCLLGLLVAVAVQPAAAGRQEPASTDDGLDLRVMSFNIRYGSARDGENRWEKRRDLVFAVLRDHRPDVAGLQEALHWQIDEIRQALPKYAMVGVGRKDGKRNGEFAPLFYLVQRFRISEQGTFWLSDTPAVPGSKSWGNGVPRICTWARFVEKDSGTAFYVYNLHLDHKSQPSRVGGVELLAERINRR
ncbi:MAG: endonuclease/exonuclease/phosphatase family protein, partial [Planctomycetota bacterium]